MKQYLHSARSVERRRRKQVAQAAHGDGNGTQSREDSHATGVNGQIRHIDEL